MPNSATIVIRDLSTGAGRTGLTVKLRRKDDNFTTDYLTATEVTGKPGVYEFTNVPFNRYKLWVNGVEDNTFGGEHGRWWPVSELTELPYLKLDGSNSPTADINFAGKKLANVGDPTSDNQVATRGYNDNRYVDKTTNQTIGGKKTFGDIVIDVGNSPVSTPKLEIRQASNPPNGGVSGLKAGYQPNNRMLFDFQNSEVKLPDPTSPTHAVNKQYVDNNFVTTSTEQSVGGKKTFGNIIIDVGNSPIESAKFEIRQASNPPNGGVSGLKAGYRANNRMLFDFLNSEVNTEDLKIKTTSSKYILGNPANNDYVWRRWVVENFMPIGSVYNEQSNTVLVDPRFPQKVSLKYYRSINEVLSDHYFTGVLAQDNVWNIRIQGHYLGYYDENILLPDWCNLISDGIIKISGNIARAPSSQTIITSRLVNVHISGDGNNDIDRIEAVNCIFISESDNVVLRRSKCIQCGFYAGTSVVSNGNNKIINCFGNYDVVWQLTDKVYSYNFIEGDNY